MSPKRSEDSKGLWVSEPINPRAGYKRHQSGNCLLPSHATSHLRPPMCYVFAFCCCDKQSKLQEKRVCQAIVLSITKGSRGRNLRGDPRRMLLPDLLRGLSCVSNITQSRLTRHGTTHSGLTPPTLISNQENARQICQRVTLTKPVFQWRFPSSRICQADNQDQPSKHSINDWEKALHFSLESLGIFLSDVYLDCWYISEFVTYIQACTSHCTCQLIHRTNVVALERRGHAKMQNPGVDSALVMQHGFRYQALPSPQQGASVGCDF